MTVVPVMHIDLPLPPSDADFIEAYAKTGSVHAAGKMLGVSHSTVNRRLTKLGVQKAVNTFSSAERERLLAEYVAAADAGQLDALAASFGRTKQYLCRQAKAAGLTLPTRKKPYLAEASSQRAVAWHEQNPHPKGFAGKRHNAATVEACREASQRGADARSGDDQAAITLAAMKTKVARYGSVAPNVQRGTWKAGWREIGPVRKYYRSRWEANYARYLEWLRAGGHILAWQHEPETFWFEKIKRGVRSYLPDFKVTENDGNIAYHEVKGWMDARSRTTIARFGRYYPHLRLIVVDQKAYRAIASKAASMVEGWE